MKRQPRVSAPSVAESAAAFGSAVGGTLKSVAGLSLPVQAMTELQGDYLNEATALWNQTLTQIGGKAGKPAALADRRFAADDWAASPASAYVAQMYLLNARMMLRMADNVEGDEKTRARVRFAVRQWIDAASPSNYLAFNPEAQRKAIETRGESIAQGLAHLLADVQKGSVSQTDDSVFEVGRNVATTEGRVVFEHELFQLIEYKPLTAKVYERPILFVPPCINKFYILDLQPDNSFIRWTVSQGHRVFVLSWVNPDEGLAERTWDDYIEQAVIKAISLVQEISGSEQINTLGFCIGGAILSTALAVLSARGRHPASSMTLLTTMLDYSDTGVLDVFIDEASVQLREMTIGPQAPQGPGLLRGKELASTFSFLRPNDLVWNYVVGNYLKGEAPPPFDLLYWNGDSTNLPGPMFCWYLRNTYHEDKLKVPGALSVCGEKIDLGAIRAPAFIYASREDHIVPWPAAYASTGLLNGGGKGAAADRVRFVLGASGHIAGVINPPAKGKRSYWTGTGLPARHEDWFDAAAEHPGSWWTDWAGWLQRQSGLEVSAPNSYGSRNYKPIEAAPGRYVKRKA